jgi:hypothetical protein
MWNLIIKDVVFCLTIFIITENEIELINNNYLVCKHIILVVYKMEQSIGLFPEWRRMETEIPSGKLSESLFVLKMYLYIYKYTFLNVTDSGILCLTKDKIYNVINMWMGYGKMYDCINIFNKRHCWAH